MVGLAQAHFDRAGGHGGPVGVAGRAGAPPAAAEDLAGFLPALSLGRRLRADRGSLAGQDAVVLVGCGFVPIDLLPEFLPVIGPLDDVLVVALALRYAARQVPREVLIEAWPGKPQLLERLLGDKSPASG